LNARLGSRPVLDLAAVRAMGLTVVGHIAARHGIAVELRAAPTGGTIAEVTLPPEVFAATARVQVSVPPPQLPQLPLPVAGAPPHPVPAEPVRLAIFEQVRSGWFNTTAPTTTVPTAAGGVAAGAGAGGGGRRGTVYPGGHRWATAADAGWQAAGDAADPVPAGRTAGGLPVRHPGAQLVPGGVNDAVAQAPAGDWRDPARVSASLAAYSRGLASGRARYQQPTTGSSVSVRGGPG
jgi:hypothetical protein